MHGAPAQSVRTPSMSVGQATICRLGGLLTAGPQREGGRCQCDREGASRGRCSHQPAAVAVRVDRFILEVPGRDHLARNFVRDVDDGGVIAWPALSVERESSGAWVVVVEKI